MKTKIENLFINNYYINMTEVMFIRESTFEYKSVLEVYFNNGKSINLYEVALKDVRNALRGSEL